MNTMNMKAIFESNDDGSNQPFGPGHNAATAPTDSELFNSLGDQYGRMVVSYQNYAMDRVYARRDGKNEEEAHEYAMSKQK